MAENAKHDYDESKIKTLSSLEHIRLRTGMYIGRIGDGSHYDDGCYILLKEVIDNAIDEFIMGHGKEVQITIEGNHVTVRDFGRGIPLGKVIDCVSKINTGAKYNDDVFQFSVGLNGVGTKAVNALSKDFFVRSHRGGEFAEASFKQGKLKNEKSGKAANEAGRHVDPLRAGPDDFQGDRVPPGTGRAAAAALQLPEHRPEADLQRADVSIAPRPAGPGAGGFAGRRQRADLSAAALREQDAGVLFHPQQQPLRRDVLFVRQRPVHQRRRHALERVSRRACSRRSTNTPRANTRATTCANAWSARWPFG